MHNPLLETFIVVSECKSFNKASKKLYISVNGEFIEGKDRQWIDEIKEDGVSFDDYKSYLLNIANTIIDFSNERSKSSAYLVSDIEGNIETVNGVAYKYVCSYDENIFDDQLLELTDGHLFDNNYDNGILIYEGMTYDESYDYKKVEIGDLIKLINSDGEEYTYEVIGFFKKDLKKVLSEEDFPENISLILPKDELVKISGEDDLLRLSSLSIEIIGTSYLDSTVNQLKEKLDNIKLIGIQNDYTFSYNLDVDDTLANSLKDPISKLKILYKIISIVMLLIVILLLYNLIIYISNNRKREFGILFSLGQGKLKTVFLFFIEIITIFTISFILSIPLSKITGEKIVDNIVKSNLKRQERIALISQDNTEQDIFDISEAVYENYSLRFDSTDCLYIYLFDLIIIFISSLTSLITIIKIKPKQLR